ncbi:unnamed protein product, partial [Meganyctiphanes norvegica]
MINMALTPLTPILKNTPRNPLASPSIASSGRRVMFDIGDTPRSVVSEYKKKLDEASFKSIFHRLESQSSKNERIAWLLKMSEMVPELDKQIDQLVLAFLKIPWYKYEESVWTSYENFILTLVTAHNFYTYQVLKILFTSLLPDIPDQDHERLQLFAGEVGEDESLIYDRVLGSIVKIHNIIPLAYNTGCPRRGQTNFFFQKLYHIHDFSYYLPLLPQ